MSGAEVTPFIYSNIGRFSDNVISVKIDEEKWGAIDTTNRTIIKPSKKFENIGLFYDGLSVFRTKKGKEGVINKKNKIIVPAIYDKVRINTKISRIILKRGDKAGVISYENKIIIPFEYNSIGMMLKECGFWGGTNENIRGNGKFSYMTSDGHRCSVTNYLLAEKDKKQTLFNADGKKIIENMDGIGSLCNSKFIKVVNNGYLGLCDSLGNNILPIKYKNDYIETISDYIASETLQPNKGIGVIIKNNNNKQFIVFADKVHTRTKEYDEIETIESRKNKNGSYVIGFVVVDNNKEGVIDRNGKIIIPVKYDYIKAKEDENEKITGYTLHLNDKETFYKLP